MDWFKVLKDEIGSELLSKLSGFLGEEEEATKKAVEGAVPTVLLGLANVAEKPDGAQRIFDAARTTEQEGFGDILGALTAGRTDSLLTQGGELLGSLFGRDEVAPVENAIGRFAGFGNSNSSKSLLGMLLPLVLGFLGRKSKKDGLDVADIASMLYKNKDVLLKLLPAALGALLPKTGVFGGGAAQPRTPTRAQTAPAGGGGLRRLLPIIVLALGAFLLWQFLNRPKQPKEEAPVVQADPAAELEGLVGDFVTTVGLVADGAPTAEAAEVLRRIDEQLLGAIDAVNGMPMAARSDAKTAITQGLTQLANTGALESAMARAEALRPTVNSILAKLRTFAAE